MHGDIQLVENKQCSRCHFIEVKSMSTKIPEDNVINISAGGTNTTTIILG